MALFQSAYYNSASISPEMWCLLISPNVQETDPERLSVGLISQLDLSDGLEGFIMMLRPGTTGSDSELLQ